MLKKQFNLLISILYFLFSTASLFAQNIDANKELETILENTKLLVKPYI